MRRVMSCDRLLVSPLTKETEQQYGRKSHCICTTFVLVLLFLFLFSAMCNRYCISLFQVWTMTYKLLTQALCACPRTLVQPFTGTLVLLINTGIWVALCSP